LYYSLEILYYYKRKPILSERIKHQQKPFDLEILKDKPQFVNKIKMEFVKCEYPVV